MIELGFNTPLNKNTVKINQEQTLKKSKNKTINATCYNGE